MRQNCQNAVQSVLQLLVLLFLLREALASVPLLLEKETLLLPHSYALKVEAPACFWHRCFVYFKMHWLGMKLQLPKLLHKCSLLAFLTGVMCI